MTQVLKLFKLQFDEKFDILKTGNKKKMFGAIFKYVGIIAMLTIAFYIIFLKLVLLGFAMNKELLSIVLLVTQLISLIFAIGNAVKTLFQNSDNEFLLTMPASPNQVFMSKIFLLYIQELIVNAIIILPLFISIGLLGGSVLGYGLYYYMFMAVSLIILPIMPLSMALILVMPVNLFLRFLRRKIIISTALIIGFVIIAILVYTALLSNFAEGFNIASKQVETVKNINLQVVKFASGNMFYFWLAQGLCSISKIYYPIGFLVVGVLLFFGAYYILKPFYFRMAMGNLEDSPKVYFNRGYKKKSKFASLLGVEMINVFRSPGNIFDYFLFVILMPFVVVVYDNLLLGMVVNQTGVQLISGAHILIVAVFATLSNIYSATALTREGVNFYMIKTTPVDYYTQTFAKIAFNAMFSVGAIIVTGIVTCFYLDIVVAIFTTLICIFISLGHIFYCFDIDLKNPKLDWYDSGDFLKFNKNITSAIITGLILALLAGLIIMLMSSSGIGAWSYVILLVLSIAFCLYRLYILILRVFYQYERLEP